MPKFAVIADDFTGACDVGVQFKKYGLKTIVLTELRNSSKFEEYDVVVVDSESRNKPPTIARNRVRKITAFLKKMKRKLIYKKIDSTLRGNIGAELDVIIDELNLKAVIVSPSFPAAKRVTLNGRVFVNGTPLEETEFAHDPIKPIKTSYILDIIEEQTSKKAGLITLSTIRGGIRLLKHSIRNLMGDGYKIIIADAESTEDLKVVARAALDLKILPCGSAGLAEGISYWLTSGSAGNVIVFSGSINDVTLRQIQRARREKNIEVIKPDLPKILADYSKYQSVLNRLIQEINAAFSSGNNVIVTSAESKSDILKIQRLVKNLKMKWNEIAEKIASFMGEIASLIVDEFKVSGIMIIGGDTAVKIIKSVGANGIIIREEFLPGIPYGVLFNGKLNMIPIITKAGGFGQEDAIIKAIERLKMDKN